MSEHKKSEIEKVREGSEGQNPLWPGEGLRKPGETDVEKKDGPEGPTTEITKIPLIR